MEELLIVFAILLVLLILISTLGGSTVVASSRPVARAEPFTTRAPLFPAEYPPQQVMAPPFSGLAPELAEPLPDDLVAAHPPAMYPFVPAPGDGAEGFVGNDAYPEVDTQGIFDTPDLGNAEAQGFEEDVAEWNEEHESTPMLNQDPEAMYAMQEEIPEEAPADDNGGLEGYDGGSWASTF